MDQSRGVSSPVHLPCPLLQGSTGTWGCTEDGCLPVPLARCWEPAPSARRGLSGSQHGLSLCIALNSYLWRLLIFSGADG